MPKVSKESATNVQHIEGVVDDHSEELGGYTAGFTTFLGDMDPAPMFKGLPDDRCQCPHWGYVLKGKITFRFADSEETYDAGDAYYVPPGHVPVMFEGCEVVEFSPTEELGKTMEVIMRNMQAATSD